MSARIERLDGAHAFYRKLGYLPVGEIPDCAANSDGALADTAILYRWF